MPRFQKRVSCDVGYPDGQIFTTIAKAITVSGTLTNAFVAGRPAVTIAGAATLDFQIDQIFRTGLSDDLQEAFGGGATAQVFANAQGQLSPPAVFTTPASVSGTPPFTGLTQFAATASRPKGINITSVAPIFSPTAAVTSTIAVYVTPFAANVAPVTTAILAPTAVVGTIQANPRVAATPVVSNYIITANTEVVVEWVISAATSATLYGVVLGFTYNFN